MCTVRLVVGVTRLTGRGCSGGQALASTAGSGGSGDAQECGGGADRAGPELGADAVADLLGDRRASRAPSKLICSATWSAAIRSSPSSVIPVRRPRWCCRVESPVAGVAGRRRGRRPPGAGGSSPRGACGEAQGQGQAGRAAWPGQERSWWARVTTRSSRAARTAAPSRVCRGKARLTLAEAGRARGATGRGSMPRARSAAWRPGPAAQETLRRRRRNGGERADAVHAVVAQGLGLAGADAVESFDRQRSEPVGHLAGADGEDAARLVISAGGGGRDRDRRPIPDRTSTPGAGNGPHPQHLPQPDARPRRGSAASPSVPPGPPSGAAPGRPGTAPPAARSPAGLSIRQPVRAAHMHHTRHPPRLCSSSTALTSSTHIIELKFEHARQRESSAPRI